MASKILIKRGDLRPIVESDLTEPNGTATDLTSCTVLFKFRNRDSGTIISGSAVIVDPATSGAVEYHWQEGDTDVAGIYDAEWEVTDADDKPQTYPTKGFIELRIEEDIS